VHVVSDRQHVDVQLLLSSGSQNSISCELFTTRPAEASHVTVGQGWSFRQHTAWQSPPGLGSQNSIDCVVLGTEPGTHV
jgi:hypothetical protein